MLRCWAYDRADKRLGAGAKLRHEAHHKVKSVMEVINDTVS